MLCDIGATSCLKYKGQILNVYIPKCQKHCVNINYVEAIFRGFRQYLKELPEHVTYFEGAIFRTISDGG